MRGVLLAMNSLIDIQKRFVNTWEKASTRFDSIDTEFLRVNRKILKLQEDQAAFRSDITGRVDAVARRMDEIENVLEKNTEETKAARIEIVALENEILNAVHTGLSNTVDAKELKERLKELERRAGL